MSKFCTNCGLEAADSQKVCTKCGTPFPVVEETPTQNETKKRSTSQSKENKSFKKKKNKKKLILPFLCLLLLAGLAGAYFFFSNKFSPETSAKAIETAINDKDYKALSHLLTVGQDDIAENEAQAFATLIEKSGQKEDFFSQLHSAAESKSDTMIKLKDKEILSLKRNGKHFSIFPKYNFEPERHKVEVTSKENADITFKFNGNTHTLSLSKDNPTTIGSFVAGQYILDAEKSISGEATKGKLIINTIQDPQVTLEFEEHFINITIEGDGKLDESETQVFVNDHEVDYNKNKEVYGPYKGKSFSVYAEGEVDGKNFKTPTETINDLDLEDGNNSVTLKFDEDEIDAYITSKEEEKNKAKEAEDRAKSAEERAKAAEERANELAKQNEEKDSASDSASEDNSSDDNNDTVTIDSEEKAIEAAEDHLGISDLSRYGEVRTPDKKSFGYGFGVFDDNDKPVMSFDVHEDGTVIEYDENGDEVDQSNPYE
ncbi:TcaA second domain-containing protein [Macrococcus armenti]|uniref:TcaA second domain-containing protein n=1 Tax=Macrococcus armenti TaxID=2875764 RepID=UPI001CCF3550|nr:zinc-ribbon domain-containing protein [Macrococcus armenti]UBH15771.1 zinc-ribbon domain-containing protein [Macrococcus armenti]UBH18130.1 zinc-ribbon domain-containing protein [Macrococcus armenti]UBH20397.1 zinc-ribbon domain-containing protein [Macrococcus armenti]